MPSKGKNLSEIPKEMIAFYSGKQSDSSVVNINDFYNHEDLSKSLTENIILKKWKGNYFLNEKEDSIWRVIMIVPTARNKFKTYQLDGSDEQTVKKLKKITKVEEFFSDNGELKSLLLDPTPSEFNKIVKSGAFTLIEIF